MCQVIVYQSRKRQPLSPGGGAMPTYAYRCEQCGETFERTETISEHLKAKPPCPKCGSDKVVSVPTPFTARTGKKS
jgi:putative FmdB family regulatory protein